MREELDFGSQNAGQHPTFLAYFDLDTLAALTPQPTINEIGAGLYYFDVNWAALSSTAIGYKAVCNGLEVADAISAPPSAPSPISPVPPAQSITSGFQTAGWIINRAAAQLGLLSMAASAAPDPFSSTDAGMIQLCDLLTTVGDDLNATHEWPQLRREFDFVTVQGQNQIALPADFHEMIDQSGWNRSSRLPVIGPLTSQEWQYLKARALGMFISIVFRLDNPALLEVNPGQSAPAGVTVAFEYISSYWVQTAAGAGAPAPSLGTDYVLFDGELALALLKLRYAEDRGFDTQKLQDKYDEKLEHCIGKSTGAPTLSLTRGSATAVDRFIDNANLPLTGFGS